MGAGGKAEQHRIADDNHCLFHAVAFLVGSSESPAELRETVARAVLADPTRWNTGTLGKSPQDYCAFIRDPVKWGGQVELAILSEVFKTELAAVDIMTGRCDTFGIGSGFRQRGFLLFSGIHFDAIVFGPSRRRLCRPDDGASEASANELASGLRQKGQFTDQNTMRLRCKICNAIVNGDYEARLHAGTYGHKDFGQVN